MVRSLPGVPQDTTVEVKINSSSTRSAKLPKLSGTQEAFLIWWTRFMVYVNLHRFARALGTVPKAADLPTTDATDLADDAIGVW